MKSIVIYFSYSGNTKELAKVAAERTHSDICELISPEPLPEDLQVLHDNVVDSKLYPDNSREPLPLPFDPARYAVFIIGSPLWLGTYPDFFISYLQSIDWRGRKVFPFVSFGGTKGNYFEKLKEICKGASVDQPLEMHSSRMPGEAEGFELWLDRINKFTWNIK